MILKELLKDMEAAMDRYDLSDDYLRAHGNPGRRIGEWQYGVSHVPCDWVYPYLYALASDERLSYIVDEVDRMTRGGIEC